MTLGALIESLHESIGDEAINMDFVGYHAPEQEEQDSFVDSTAEPGNTCSEEIDPTSLHNWGLFMMEVHKRAQEPLGMSLEEHAEAIVVSKIFDSGAIARTKLQDSTVPSLEEGDVLLSVNGAGDMGSIMPVIFSATDLHIDCRRGPYKPPHTSAPSGESVLESGRQDEDCNIEADGSIWDGRLQRTQSSEHLRQMDLADRRMVAAGIGQNSLSELIAERIARSRRNQK